MKETKILLHKADVSGSIYLYRVNSRQMRLSSNSKFFNDEIIIKIDGEKIVFTKPNIDYNGKRYKMHHNKNTGYFETTILTDIEFENFEVEEDETDCDRITIYYR